MREIGIPFQVHAANINEDQKQSEPPIDYALRLAREKAQVISKQYPQSYVLGADTIVVIDGEVLGKPIDHADAARMLRLLSGREHEVTTAVSLIAPNVVAPSFAAPNTPSLSKAAPNTVPSERVAADLVTPNLVVSGTLAETRASTTKVYFREIAEAEIQQYVAGGEPMDKAGAYAIQGGASRWTDRIEGEFSNVVGLPLSLVTEMLRTTELMKS